MSCPVFVGLNSQVMAIDSSQAAGGANLWTKPWTAPTGSGDVLVEYDAVNNQVVACVEGFAYGLAPDTGVQAWHNSLDSLTAGPTAMLLGLNSMFLYVATINQVAAIIPSSGATASFGPWAASQGSGSISMIQTSNLNLVVNVDGYLYGLSPELQQLWSNPMSGYGHGQAGLGTSC